MKPDDLQDIYQRVSKGTQAAQVMAAMEPFLKELETQCFRELASTSDPTKLLRLSGKAETIDRLGKTLQTAVADGQAANQELQGG